MSSPRGVIVYCNKLCATVIVFENFTVFFFNFLFPSSEKTHKTTILSLKERNILSLFLLGVLRQKMDVSTQQLASHWSHTRGN